MTLDSVGFEAHYTLRESIADYVKRDLLGPAHGPEEVLEDDAPITTYPIGVLFPRSRDEDTRDQLVDAENEIDGLDEAPLVKAAGGDSDDTDPGVALANRRRPSSMGITFAVDPAICASIVFAVSAARYEPEDAEGRPVTAARSEARSTEGQRERWRRVQLRIDPKDVDVRKPGQQRFELSDPGLELRVLVRPENAVHAAVTVTATVVNRLTVGKYDLQDAYCFYQPVLEVRAGDAGVASFVERPRAHGAVDAEQAMSRLLYRHAPSFATGHGCAARWDWTPPPVGAPTTGRAAVSAVRTEFVPSHEVLLTDSNPQIDDRALAMWRLATAQRDEVVSTLTGLLDGYAEWIRTQTSAAESLPTEHAAAAREQLEACGRAQIRMRRGVGLLDDPNRPEIMRAFQLANRAMAEQRARTSWFKDGRRREPDPTAGRWRPFQICFILLCLEGIVDPDGDDRGIADLLWFPTGGGKTEAYLGLIAFTAFHRRLRDGAAGAGVTVLMRYTLRLLTLQQFERAASLLCAMELMRRQEPKVLGLEEFSIGMWVGRSATPNRLDSAAEALRRLRANPDKALTQENPVQLRTCPWCGSPLEAADYEVEKEKARMWIRCHDSGCDFHGSRGLPVHLVDEAVYAARPTLVIATVDKFASMPWRDATAALFNRDDTEGTKPPELIVQDELHLISGPLGTLTGLYETAVDALACRPKIVASTATIRRAGQQGLRLFDREVSQFPPGGLDARDSWFAVESPRQGKAARSYLGLMTSSTSQATLLVRVYAALLQAAYESGAPNEILDAYWTLVGYFNSLRLLSAAELQVVDDVQDRIEYLAARGGAGGAPRRVEFPIELSSRASASDIPKRLKAVELAHPDRDAVDVLLATNMISVGVDIDRLGLMAVMGQPQTTAEYIQATSRVGRRHPGLVAVLLNSTRSRDRSHYENFQQFHSALYREVESTSVTPFSARARDRGLHAVIVALARLMIPAARPNAGAARIEDFVDSIDETVRPVILSRVSSVDSAEKEATAKAFDEFVAWWRLRAGEDPGLVYEPPMGKRLPALLSVYGEDQDASGGWPTLWSLRDVDASSPLFLESRS